MLVRAVALSAVMASAACSSSTTSSSLREPNPEETPVADAGSSPKDASTAIIHPEATTLTKCAAKPGGIESIVRLVEHVNALPAPVDVPCLVASLPRPLALVATSNTLSAQPAASVKSPRVFMLFDKLVVSVVPEGSGAPFAELGEWVTPTRTLKGELAFPVEQALPTETPFVRIEQSNHTTPCGVCHRNEATHESIAHGYVSSAFRPINGLVKLPALEAEHAACAQAADTSTRCMMFHAIFDFGEVTQGAFSAEVESFP